MLGNDRRFYYKMVKFPAIETSTITKLIKGVRTWAAKKTDTDKDLLVKQVTIETENLVIAYITKKLFDLCECFELEKKLSEKQLTELAKQLVYGVHPTAGKKWTDILTLEDFAVFVNYAKHGSFIGYKKEVVQPTTFGPGMRSTGLVRYSEIPTEVCFPENYNRLDYDVLTEWLNVYINGRDATRFILQQEPPLIELQERNIKQGVEQRMLLELNEPTEPEGETDYEALKRMMFAALDLGGVAGYTAMSLDVRMERNPQKRQILREWKAANAHLF